MTHDEEYREFVERDMPVDTADLCDRCNDYPCSCFEDEEPDDCYECGGEGWVTGDCGEDTCCCADPDEEHGIEPCPVCNPGGLVA